MFGWAVSQGYGNQHEHSMYRRVRMHKHVQAHIPNGSNCSSPQRDLARVLLSSSRFLHFLIPCIVHAGAQGVARHQDGIVGHMITQCLCAVGIMRFICGIIYFAHYPHDSDPNPPSSHPWVGRQAGRWAEQASADIEWSSKNAMKVVGP